MASPSIRLVVSPRGKPIKTLPEDCEVPRNAPASEIYQQLAAASGISVHRLRVTKGSDGQLVPHSKDVMISRTGLMGGSKVYVKDLGRKFPLIIGSYDLTRCGDRTSNWMENCLSDRIHRAAHNSSPSIRPPPLHIPMGYKVIHLFSCVAASNIVPPSYMHTLCKTRVRNNICPSVLSSDHALHECLQEFRLLLDNRRCQPWLLDLPSQCTHGQRDEPALHIPRPAALLRRGAWKSQCAPYFTRTPEQRWKGEGNTSWPWFRSCHMPELHV